MIIKRSVVGLFTLLIVANKGGEREALSLMLCSVYTDTLEILLADTARQACDLFKKRTVDLVLIDMEATMPDSHAILSWVQKEQPFCEIIALVSSDPLTHAEQTLSFALERYLAKPIQRSELLLRISGALSDIEATKRCGTQMPTPDLSHEISGDAQEGGAQATWHRNLVKRIRHMLWEKNLDGAMCCMETTIDALFFSHQNLKAVLHAVRRLLTRVACQLSEGASLSFDLDETLSRLMDERLTQEDLSPLIRDLFSSWIDAMDDQSLGHMEKTRQNIEAYIRRNYARNLSVKTIAHALHFSEPYFSRLFTRCFHCNFVAYLTDVRLQQAAKLLRETDLGICKISVSVGYADANYFAKVFKKTYGISPSAYRRRDAAFKADQVFA